MNIYDQFISKNIRSINYLDKVSFNKIKNITRIESQQNFYKQNNEKSTQQYILFIEVLNQSFLYYLFTLMHLYFFLEILIMGIILYKKTILR